MDQNRSNRSKWTKLTKIDQWIEFDQSGPNGSKWTEIDRIEQNRPNDSLICSHIFWVQTVEEISNKIGTQKKFKWTKTVFYGNKRVLMPLHIYGK